MTDDIIEKLRDIYLVVEEIKQFPQTYNSILKDKCKDGTCQVILRRKLNNLFKDGVICKTAIPGTRFGMIVFYTYPKEYYILVEGGRMGSNVFCFFKFERLSRFYIKLNDYWKLESNIWIKYNDDKVFFEGNVLLFI